MPKACSPPVQLHHRGCPLQVLRLSGYTAAEKQHIGRQYLEKQAASEAGVAGGLVDVTDDAMRHLIVEYCRRACPQGDRQGRRQRETERERETPPPPPPPTPPERGADVFRI